MVKAKGKGRGGGRGRGRPSAGGRQPGPSNTGTTSQGAVQRSPSAVQAFLGRFSGPRGSQLTTAKQSDQVIQWIADKSSSSLSTTQSTATSQFGSPPHPAAQSPGPQPGPSRQSKHSQDAYSEELFSVPMQATPQPPEELHCTDAQPFHPSQPQIDESGDSQLVCEEVLEDDDETQLSISEVVVGAGTPQGGQVEDSEEELLDDEVTDPSWLAKPTHDSGSEEEEAEAEPVARRSGVVAGRSRATTPISVRKASYHKPKCSAVWKFFTVSEVDRGTVVCNVCHTKLSRGGTKSNFTTSSMHNHMQAKHPSQWTASRSPAATGDAPAMSAHVEMRSSTPDPGTSTSRPAPTPSPTPSSLGSTLARPRSLQLSLPQTLERKSKYAANHPHAQTLTVHIAKLLSLEMLPYRLVETVAFRNLMAVAVPRYSVPSRHFFSRSAVPTLQQHVYDNIVRALSNAVADRVHLTTDTWTSGSGQGHYISVTAHWVNLVEAGTETDPGSAHVLPTPRVAGPNSVTVSPAYYASDPPSSSSSSSPSTSHTPSKTTPHSVGSLGRGSTAVAKRQQAVLKLLSLGDRRHTAQELLQGISQETNRWFQPQSLQTGMVVCDNGRNLVAALKLGRLTHVPCMAHVLNLVVQRFLKSYPGLSQFLVKVRRISAHFRKSNTDAATLRTLQQRLKLPSHRLICDVPTRWNSTLHMLARLHGQRRAIVEYQLQHAHLSVSQPPQITFEEWHWMSDLCQLLATFEESTRMVSGDADIISLTIPLICLLRQSLDYIRSDGERGSEESISQRPLDEEVEEEDEEEEVVTGFGEQATHAPSITSIQRAWPVEEEEEEEENEELEEESFSTSGHSDLNPVKSLGHMVDFVLACLSRDPRITAIMGNPDFWVFSLLDPRYKENLSSLIPAGERSERLNHYHKVLVEKLVARFPSDDASGRARTSGAAVAGDRCTVSGRGRGTLSAIFARFVSTQPEGPNPQVVISRRQNFKNMVKEYTSDRTIVLQDSSAPFNYWVSKLNVWHELALYALEVLACPAASVLSERVFSAAGGIITDQRTRLSTESADRLTFIKMNQKWISPNFSGPPVESRHT